jgi:uncharacterized RDD family membrane protein YckC
MTPAAYRPREPAGPPIASFGARLGSRLIDTVVIGGVALVIVLVVYLVSAVVSRATDVVFGAAPVVWLLLPAAWFFAVPIVRIGGEGNRPGQTLGKAAVGIRVVRDDRGASRAGYGPAFGRFFLNLVPVLGLLSCLSMLWTPDRRCWHDAWTGTRVERSPVPGRARANRWSPAILATCLALVLSLGGLGVTAYLARTPGTPYATGESGYSTDDGSGAGGGYGSGPGYGTGGAGSSDGSDSGGAGGGYDSDSGPEEAAAYCLGDATPELYATTPTSVIAICESDSGLVYHGQTEGDEITLPATRVEGGYQAVNEGSTPTYYDITPDELTIRTENAVLGDEPIDEWHESNQ